MDGAKANLVFLLAESKKQSNPMRVVRKAGFMSIMPKVRHEQA